MAREAFVEEGVIGAEEIQNAAVFANDAVGEHFGLAAQRLAEVVVEVGEGARVGCDRAEVAQEEPLVREVRHEAPGPGMKGLFWWKASIVVAAMKKLMLEEAVAFFCAFSC